MIGPSYSYFKEAGVRWVFWTSAFLSAVAVFVICLLQSPETVAYAENMPTLFFVLFTLGIVVLADILQLIFSITLLLITRSVLERKND